MAYRIEGIELYVRETPPGRMLIALGRQSGKRDTKQELLNPIAHVRLMLRDSSGQTSFGCSGDRLSVRWLDKRPGRTKDVKRRELVELLQQARGVYLRNPDFESPFQQWRNCHSQIMRIGKAMGQEDLTSTFASALIERAMIDGVCRLANKPVFEMVTENRLGFEPAEVHPEAKTLRFTASLPAYPRTQFHVRHTIGLADPLSDDEVPEDQRVNDGLPETLQGYIKQDGVRYFKIKISGDPQRDLQRLERIWSVVVNCNEPVITLDANEAYGDLKTFAEFLTAFENELTGMFQHVEYVEQPLPRALTLDPSTRTAIRGISQKKRLLIDEADGTIDAYKRAFKIGYLGTSHKNCKGFFKTLLNHALVVQFATQGAETFLSAEDLQNLPVVPLQQDFATLGILGIPHCERNGHHYNFGLSMLSETDKANAVKRHPDMYQKRGDEWFLRVHQGMVECGSLQCPGFGVYDEPDWNSMFKINEWVRKRHPV